ncbi:FAD-dependent oxidoreductase [uncultured Maritimibacter sp.]|uniref:NAD(P)/FAD-dependent oxidoreductase n=1 Tax=Maritimibacter sp. UBA3975 TaxID=1946833 RepID=UPI00269D2925|tara:strand:- start:2320 stop:3468 length:1149 start_codon:yes stop_codon:yes gene_type:complete
MVVSVPFWLRPDHRKGIAIAGIVVIGGGLAGAATATHLAQAGRAVVLLERDRTPTSKVCGEFLGPMACRELAGLGIDLTALGAQAIGQMRLFAGRRSADARLPFQASGLSRTILDEKLRGVAAETGVDVRLGVRATEIARRNVTLNGGGHIAADDVVVATGKHEVRGVVRRSVANQKDAKIGIKEHLRLAPEPFAEMGKAVELHFFPGGYAGLMPVADGVANLSIAMETEVWRREGLTPATYLDWLRTSVGSLSERLAGADRVFDRPLMVSGVPYGFRLWNAPSDAPGLWRVGDQAIVTPSLTGEGMSLALGTARCLAECLIEGAPQSTYRDRLRRRYGRQIAVARAFEVMLERQALRMPLLTALAMFPGALRTGATWSRGG